MERPDTFRLRSCLTWRNGGGDRRNYSIDKDGKHQKPHSPARLRSIVCHGQTTEERRDGTTTIFTSSTSRNIYFSQGTSSASELTLAKFGTLHYGCRGEIKAVIFNDGPETAPFMVSIDMEGNRGVRGGNTAGADKKGGKEQLPFEVCVYVSHRGCCRGERRNFLSLSLKFSVRLAKVSARSSLIINPRLFYGLSFLTFSSSLW